MRQHSAIAKVVVALIALAIGAVQLFGGSRKFICNCGETPIVVKASHCHGPHGDNCHADRATEDCGDEEGSGDRRDHEQVKEDLKSRFATSTTVSAPMPMVLAILPVSITAPQFAANAEFERRVEIRGSPPASVVVARTVVRLI